MTSPPHLNDLLDELGLGEAATFTAVHGADEDAVIRRFGGDPERTRPLPLEELRDHYDSQLILVSRSGPAVVVVENNNYQGSREEVLRPLSRLGRTASAFWNVNAVSRLSLAEGGLISSVFEMVAPEEPEHRFGTRPHAWDPLLEGLDLDDDACLWGTGLAAVERATGARFDEAWIRGPHRAVAITPVPQYLLGQGLVNSPLLDREPFLTYLAGLGPALLGRMRRHALDLALTHADLTDHPLACAALTADTLPATARQRLRDDLTAAHDQALTQARTLLTGEPEEVETEWERPSHLVFRQGLVFDVLAWCVAAHLPTPTDRLPDILSSLVTAMTGDGERVAEFWMVKHLHDAARERT
ncbi:DUF6461 domain-containing protein [Streptomyces spectabilis]|uniref:Uncharacterized protein n=1 Tax=Streptomyces spectabilis TaxID=68270 RepID=A0A516RH81_STRST|nr:DUF6461 domain-containing protein [Streptomyces spectabilis]QDQ15006.1 hypothetical protein FH965_34360 [Streptomyces spectabilis]